MIQGDWAVMRPSLPFLHDPAFELRLRPVRAAASAAKLRAADTC
jgi:hypothetical protein